MSDRPTISVYANDCLVECYYMRNWPMESLINECARLIKTIGDATDRREVLSRLGEDPTVIRNEGELMYTESCSEFPVVIDLTRRLSYLKDDYPQGHPEQSIQPITSIKEYRQVCNTYMIWPPQRPISFAVLMQVACELADKAPNGKTAAESKNSFIENVLPDIIANAFAETD